MAILYKRGTKSGLVLPVFNKWQHQFTRSGPYSSSLVLCESTMFHQPVRATLLKTAKKRLKRQPLQLLTTTNQVLTAKPVGLRMGKGKGKRHTSYSYLQKGQLLLQGGRDIGRAVRGTTLGFKVKLVQPF